MHTHTPHHHNITRRESAEAVQGHPERYDVNHIATGCVAVCLHVQVVATPPHRTSNTSHLFMRTRPFLAS